MTHTDPGAQRARPAPVFALRAALPRFLIVMLFAVGMAYVESAAVLYLRTIYGGVDPVGPRVSPFDPLPELLGVEIGREAATMLMLATVGWLAGRGFGGRSGAFLVAFGTWDVFYYVFLWVFAGWPASPLAPDILFLIPLPWWGPVLAPALIALVMVVGGGLAMARDLGDGLPLPDRRAWLLTTLGALLALAAFMIDALQALGGGLPAAFAARGGAFPWPLYLAGLAIGALGLWRAVATPRRRAAVLGRARLPGGVGAADDGEDPVGRAGAIAGPESAT